MEGKLEKVYNDIMEELYKYSTPPGDYKTVIKGDRLFMEYYLSMDKQDEIIDSIIKRNKLSKLDASRLRISIYLGPSPKFNP